MAKKGCGLLLFVSVVVFCAGAAYSIAALITMMLAWMTLGKVAQNPALAFVFQSLFWSAPLVGGTIGVFWARTMNDVEI